VHRGGSRRAPLERGVRRTGRESRSGRARLTPTIASRVVPIGGIVGGQPARTRRCP
jgi:hypothetical protein